MSKNQIRCGRFAFGLTSLSSLYNIRDAMFFSLQKILKFSAADRQISVVFFLPLIFFAVSARNSFPASHAESFDQPEINKKMNQTKDKEIAPGEWGGTGISLEIEKSAAIIRFDCAEARISEKLVADKKGNFSAAGTYLRRAPGPIRLNSPLKSQSAKFEGKISGTQMSLKITLTESKEVVGNYVLQRGKSTTVRRCL